MGINVEWKVGKGYDKILNDPRSANNKFIQAGKILQKKGLDVIKLSNPLGATGVWTLGVAKSATITSTKAQELLKAEMAKALSVKPDEIKISADDQGDITATYSNLKEE